MVALELIRDLPINEIFTDNGYEIDEDSKEYLKSLRSQATGFIDNYIEKHIQTMNCDSVERLISFRNHQTKIQNKLEGLGFGEYAKRVKVRKEKELDNIEEIKSRQELREDYQKYIEDSLIDKYTTYVIICSMIKSGKDLQERVQKYKISLGKDGAIIQEILDKRVSLLESVRDRINQDISDIWDDLYDVKCSEDVEDLLDRISLVLQKGISQADQEGLEELQENLQEFLRDINTIKESTYSRKVFVSTAEDMKNKYEESDFDFEVLPIIEKVIDDISKHLDEKEEEWKKQNLSLGSKSREDIHRWKQKTQFLPEYLSDETVEAINKLNVEVDELISEGKIEDVLFYFEKLNLEEKKECLEKIISVINKK